MTPEIRRAIHAAADAYQFDAALLEAQVIVESSGKPDAFRFECALWARWRERQETLAAKEYGALAACSFGLLQVLLETAMEHGFPGRPETLFVPMIGLDCGCRYLAHLRDTHPREPWPRILCAYNGGPGVLRLPVASNIAYAERVAVAARGVAHEVSV